MSDLPGDFLGAGKFLGSRSVRPSDKAGCDDSIGKTARVN